MTRENKLALVVGFALILFVGILISDYVAATQTRESADITPSLRDSLGGHTDAGRPDLIQYTTLINTTQLSSDHVADGSPTPSPSSNEIFMGQIEPPIHSTPETIGINDAYSGELPFTYHTVRPRESLATICR
ncbi:MAG: hypothetical protein O7G85_08855, partial [Planctomycetota bacterium]|nr:hypothetical protein [Planctomycetota bacterium]